jgi:type III restriction enzyme
MELKEYQRRALAQIKRYLELLSEWRAKAEASPDAEIDFAAKGWEKTMGGRGYHARQNGLDLPLPNFCLKIPTGGGKTLLAVKTIDLVNASYLRRRTGLVLWVVPTTQIYSQTIAALRDREHPYRQHLDIASGGRTLIREKLDRFTPLDVTENQVILMLMLPSAARQSKETLRVFRDNGGFQEFFPEDDDRKGHEALLGKVPNLDTFGPKGAFWGRQVKTSLGNTLRLLSPLIILDEGHKAYSETAQDTLRGFNPSMIVELSATPTHASNVLVDISGVELNREEMIKLDLHIISKASPDWKDTLLAGVEKLDLLKRKAREYEANSGRYIRPIALIQVERTGKEQRDGRFIHAEDVREYLIKTAGIAADQVAVTSAELKEIAGMDLLSRDCPVRYIITKKALQEGWDCAFAYILTILTNPRSKNSLTQLVGRILRQPFARKTGVRELDESYVFAYQQKAAHLLASIKTGFEQEGLGDLYSQVVADEGSFGAEAAEGDKYAEIRDKYRKAAREIILPVFVMKEKGKWRRVSYDMDIAARIPWDRADLGPLACLPLSGPAARSVEVAVALADDKKTVVKAKEVQSLREGGLHADPVFLTRHLVDIVPNPWVAHGLGKRVLASLLKTNNPEAVADHFVFIIEETRKRLALEKDRLAREVFEALLASGELRFMVIGQDMGFHFPKRLTLKPLSKRLTQANGAQLQLSLFDAVPEDQFNETEKSVAWYLEDQDRLFFWFRNQSRQDYAIQGWKKNKIYPDFIVSSIVKEDVREYNAYVVETKGIHLKNEDTAYKQEMFKICSKHAQPVAVRDLDLALAVKSVRYEVVFEDEWKRKLNELLS